MAWWKKVIIALALVAVVVVITLFFVGGWKTVLNALLQWLSDLLNISNAPQIP